MVNCLNKITVRNFITIATISIFLALVVYAVVINPATLNNPLITFFLGTFVSVTTMVYQFYYRKNPSNKKPKEITYDDFKDDICQCCGNDIK